MGSSLADTDYLTVKHAPDGRVLWAARYDSPNSERSYSDDAPAALAVDALGNIAVTGAVSGWAGQIRDIATVMYSPGGEELWAAVYEGSLPPGPSDLYGGRAVAFSSDGGVLVLGSSGNSFVTVKYSEDGRKLWDRRVQSQAQRVLPAAVAVDGAGEVVVTGALFHSRYDSEYKSDFLTVKYTGEGEELWRSVLAASRNSDPYGVAGLAIDPEGNIIVAGSQDYAATVVKYSSRGEALWTARHDELQRAIGLVLDRTGSVYIAGDGFTLARFSSLGEELWTARREAPDVPSGQVVVLAFDGWDGFYLAGTVNGDFHLVKYSVAGKRQ